MPTSCRSRTRPSFPRGPGANLAKLCSPPIGSPTGIVILSGASQLHREAQSKDLLFARRAAAVCLGLLLAAALSCSAQVLARPGWAGSGVTVETWWRRAVFYRIDVTRFQDSTGDGRGDLAGVTERLDYLQSLGVDAIIIDPEGMSDPGPAAQPLTAAFDDLTRQAANHHLRVLVALPAPASQRSDATAQYLARARAWLNQGAAGLYVPTRQLAALNNPPLAAYLVHALRMLTNSFPGERILLADAAPDAPAAEASAIAHDVQLVAAPPIALATPDAASLRRQMLADLPASATTTTLLQASRRLPTNLPPAQRNGLEAALAAALLASRTAVLIDYGQELGEQEAGQRSPAANTAPLMQWTPTNLTRAPRPPAPESAAAKPGAVYGAFHPYIKPLPRSLFPPPSLPDVELSNTPPPVDPNSLPGLTSGDIAPTLADAITPNAAAANVAVEDADPHSLLNLYRRLVQLHHENASLRNGAEDILDFDADDALLWLRRAPAGSRTSATVIVACNLSAKPFALSLDAVNQLHLRHAALRNLLSDSQPLPQPPERQPVARETTDSLTIPPYNLFLGELHP
jgi:alpha-glucosidase